MDNKYDNVIKLVDTEIEKIGQQPALNDTMVATLYKLVDIRKDICEIEEKEMSKDVGYAQRAYGLYYDDGMRSMGGNSYGRPMYPYGRVYDGGMGMRGRSYNDGYSGNDQVMDHLRMAMDMASDEDREMIRKVMNKLSI